MWPIRFEIRDLIKFWNFELMNQYLATKAVKPSSSIFLLMTNSMSKCRHRLRARDSE